MRTSIKAALAAVSLLAVAGCSSEPAADDTAAVTGTGLDGTWTVDLSSVKMAGEPDELLLTDGTYTCSTCNPPLTIAADGEAHDVTGRPYADTITVTVDGPNQVTLSSTKGDRAMGSTVLTVSDDGKTMTRKFTDTSVPDAAPVTGSTTSTRVGDAPAGAHAISGKWQPASYDDLSAEGSSVTYSTTDDTITSSSPDGTGFEAPLDGTDAPVKGDVANTMVSASKTGDNTYVLTYKRDGETLSTTTLTVDGDTLHGEGKNARTGDTTTWDAKRS